MRVSRRRIMLIELGAGVAATLLTLGALGLLLFAPLIAYCSAVGHPVAQSSCPASAIRYATLLHAGASAGTWTFLVGMLLVSLIGAVGAIGEARYGWRWSIGALWAGTLLVFAGCALGVRGVGAVYLPATLALCLAAYASLLRHRLARPRRAPAST
ncbi:MAG: hypothetical protein ABI068_12355 [Ktedonobacterales bacterium]